MVRFAEGVVEVGGGSDQAHPGHHAGQASAGRRPWATRASRGAQERIDGRHSQAVILGPAVREVEPAYPLAPGAVAPRGATIRALDGSSTPVGIHSSPAQGMRHDPPTYPDPVAGLDARSCAVPAPEHPASPDPFADLDSLLELEDEIRSLSVQIHAATHRLLVLIGEFDRRRGWEVGGHRSCADWLSFRTGIDRGAARERVRAARALEDLPRTSEAMSRGELSFSQVRALTRVATADDEDELLEIARDNSASRLERLVRGWKSRSAESDRERDERLHRSRHLSVFPDEDGMYVVKGALPAELGALLMRAIEAASDVLFREEGRRTPVELDPEGSRAAAARRRADALGLLAERALAAGFTAEDGAPVSGTRPERYQVVLHVEEETLRSEGESQGGKEGRRRTSSRPGVSAETRSGRCPDPNGKRSSPGIRVGKDAGTRGTPCNGVLLDRGGLYGSGSKSSEMHGRAPSCAESIPPTPRSHLDDGTRVSAETSRRLCCDAAIVKVREAPDGSVLDVGRKTRTIPPALRRALDIRDRGCRFPGCTSRFTDAHHVVHWADGGDTSLTNCLLLCRHHHRLVHEGRWRIHWLGKALPLFVDPRGQQHFDGGWKPPVSFQG